VVQLQSVSTDGVPSHRRVDYWNDVTCSALTAQVADPVDRRAFCGRMTYLDVGEVRLLELNASGSTVTRTRSHVGNSSQPLYLVRLAISGEISTSQAGREVCLRAGDFTLCDTSRPYRMFFREPSDVLIIRISRDRLQQYIGRPEAMVSVFMPGHSGLSGFASRHLRDLWAAAPEFIAHGAAPRILEMTMQLLASAYSAVPEARADRSCLASTHRAQVRDVIERRLTDPDLTPSSIAAELRLTPWYVHRLYANEQETIARYILRRRLEHCAVALKDPLQASQAVTTIAFRYGFNSVPHFCRVFRNRYGMTPSEHRHS
jgi:AraC-like DNA-binding protein